jgi:ribose/xylose/arabinose/galactoside ABC-type transport system permease subunit
LGISGRCAALQRGQLHKPGRSQPVAALRLAAIAGTIGGIPILIIVALAAVAAAQIIVSFTPLGAWMRATGSNENAARAVGVRTNLIKVFALAASGSMAALAGIMITAWQVSIYPLTAAGYSLQAIAGVILGGIPFSGGRGTVVGAALGVLVIGVVNDIIVLIGLPALYEHIFVAVILVLAGLQARLASAK